MIKHLVLSGGGPNNIIQLGCFYELWNKKIISYDTLESIYSTSAGSLLGLNIVLKYDMNIVKDFYIKRPWHKVFSFKAENLMQMVENNGYIDMTFIEDIIDLFLSAKNVSKDITFIELYNISNITFNVFTVKLESFEKVIFNHENAPSMSVKTAILMSCALPPIFKPILYKNEYYLDGGILCNYPINECLLKYPNKEDSLGIHVTTGAQQTTKLFSDKSTMPDYMMILLKILISNIHKNKYVIDRNEIIIKTNYTALHIEAWKILIDKDKLQEMYNEGIELGKKYIKEQNLETDQACQH
jgi:predicted acylesterase/phospholipase RssA